MDCFQIGSSPRSHEHVSKVSRAEQAVNRYHMAAPPSGGSVHIICFIKCFRIDNSRNVLDTGPA